VLTPFYRYCATCHQSADRLPPNFLEGTPAQVAANIQHCAPRLEVRLAMWSASPDQRIKTPMPPIYALYRAHTTPESWRDSSDLAALRTYVQNILQKESRGLANDVSTLPGGYESLRPCLPPPNKD
jgi:mono/diheme cytochrome c family protein